jgi:hypothetical protein
LAFIILAPSANLWAQTERGSITGLVKDSSGAVVPGVTVTATNPGTNTTVTAKTQGDGSYLISNLLPAVYSVSAEVKGFKRETVTGLKLDSGTTLTQDLTLQVGATTETVEVKGTADLVNTSTATVGATIDLSHILELPLRDRLVIMELNLIPGVFVVGGNDTPWYDYGISMIAAGARGNSESVIMSDGVQNSGGANGAGNTNRADPPPDVFQEVQIQTNDMSAKYGGSGNFFVNEVVKSGSNQLHGGGYEVVRNDKFDTAGWGNLRRPPLRRNNLGGEVGGPLIKNKLFFFFGYEYLWNRLGQTVTANLGLPAFRKGDFSQATALYGSPATKQVVPIYDPASYAAGNQTTQISCNGVMNVICPARLDPAALKVVAYLPQPNIAPLQPNNNGQNWQSYPNNWFNMPFYVGRADYNLGTKTKIFLRTFSQDSEYRGWGGGNGADPAWGNAAGAQHSYQHNQSYAFNVTRLFSPTFFLDFTMGWERTTQNLINFADQSINYGNLLGIANYPNQGFFGSFGFSGGLVPVDSLGNGGGRENIGMVTQFTPNFTKMIGNHTLEFGGQYMRFASNNISRAGANFNFGDVYTAEYLGGALQQNTGITLADFLLGDYTSISSSATPTEGNRSELYALYLQDNWRATKNLTLNLGLRYETVSPQWEVHNRFQSFNPFIPNPLAGTTVAGIAIPSTETGVTTFAGPGQGNLGQYFWTWKKISPSPRIGFAYRLFGRSDFVLRGGFGMYWDNPAPFGSGINGPAFGENYSSQTYTAASPSPTLSAGLPAVSLVFPSAAARNSTYGEIGTPFAAGSIQFMLPGRKNPYMEEYNLSLQHEWKGTLIEVGYLGNSGRHLVTQNRNINAIPANQLANTGVATALRRPYQIYGTNGQITIYQDSGYISEYNALAIRTDHRFANGLGWTTAFTWSKWLDNQNQGGSGVTTTSDNVFIENPFNMHNEYSYSVDNVPFRLTYAPIYELPVGKGKHFLNQGGVVNAILGGWEVSLMGTLQSGVPMGPSVSNGGQILGDSTLTNRPNLVAGCNPKASNAWQPLTNGNKGFYYTNINCFTAPSAYTYGTAARYLPNIRGMGIAQQNLMLSKNFYFKEHYRVQLRGEAIDLFNTPQFADPNETYSAGSGTFGTVTGTDGFTRRVMEFAIKIYF